MRNIKILIILSIISLSIQAKGYITYITVAKDTSGDFTSIQEAVNSCKSFPDKRITIFVKNGIYNEKVVIHSWNSNILLKGESKDSTIITFNECSGKIKNGTFRSYTLKVCGNDFIVENLTIENTYGSGSQAVALHIEADRVIIRNCNILGNQDTIYAAGENARQYFKNCYIEGTTDYIFGAATAVFEKCTLHTKRNSYITAASTPERIKFGYVFIDCKLTFAGDVAQVYLGRPWRDFAKTVFINCELGPQIRPEGWHHWEEHRKQTAFYAEYKCYGEGANRSQRVEWSKELTDKEAAEYTLENIFSENNYKLDSELNWYK